jgi:hypothetical protein
MKRGLAIEMYSWKPLELILASGGIAMELYRQGETERTEKASAVSLIFLENDLVSFR